MNKDVSNPFHNAILETLQVVVCAQMQKLDPKEQKFDHLEQTITDLAQLMGKANRDSEEEWNLTTDLPQDKPNPQIYNEISFYDGRFLKKRFNK